MRKVSFLLFFLSLCITTVSSQGLRLPQLFQDGMVLQRGVDVPVWGWTDAGARVSVVFKKKVYQTTADSLGRWQLKLPSQKAGGPYTITVKTGAEERLLSDVLFGDVWLCSGQSNIDVTIERVYPQYGKVIDDYANPRIRMFRVQTDTDLNQPKDDVKPTPIHWLTANRQNAWLFSAVGYFLARDMYERTGVPQGVIVNSLGGSPIQAWLPADTIARHHPVAYRRLQFYQDPAVTRSLQQSAGLASNRWQKLLDASDAGLRQGFKDPSYDDSQWKAVPQFQPLTAKSQFNGSCWARLHVNIDAAHAGQPARLLLGTLYDMDYTYLNGQEVGRTYYQYPPRRYDVPAGLLRQGDNVISVRIVTKGGAPHFIKEKPYQLIFPDGTVQQLPDAWRVHEGVEMPRMPQADGSVQNLPSVLYNGMLAPLAPYALSGVVWYQGESNTGEASLYRQMLTQLISSWRQRLQQPALPFVVVQLANYMEPSPKPQNTGWSELREAQRQTVLHTDNTALAVIIDLGEKVDIHPLRKQEVAQRVALCFDRLLWHPRQPLSPAVVSTRTDGTTITLQADMPLMTEPVLHEFEVAGVDGRFVNAEASCDGTVITVRSPLAHPVYVRYAWKNNPDRANVYSRNHLPMSPFCEPVTTYLKAVTIKQAGNAAE